MTVWFLLFAFFLGSLPFSVWLGRLAGTDPRRVGDGNPGATNAWKSGGWRLGLPVILLDFAKGFLPVMLARWFWGWDGLDLVAVTVAPVLGHRFSPFLRGRGGKGMLTLLAVWAGLTLWKAPLIVGSLLIIGTFGLRWRDGWVLLLSAVALLIAILLGHWGSEALALWVFSLVMIWAGYRHTLLWPPQKPLT
ncbi:MAG: glycerol-3-phosphate acyltransferase [Anaerolineales bacterium]